jgi:transcriptional regulator with XRE-family HTH domain
MDISENLLRILEISKCNQKDLAEKIGVCEKSVGRWLAGHTITQTNLRKISLKLDISMRWLTEKDYEGPMSKKAEWAYNISKRRFSHQEASRIYDRIDEIMQALDIKTPAKLVALAEIDSPLKNDCCFFGRGATPLGYRKNINSYRI